MTFKAWTPALVLGLLFVLLLSKGFSKKILFISLALAAVTTLQYFLGMTDNGPIFTFITAGLFFYDAIYGISLLIERYRKRWELKQQKMENADRHK